MQRDISFYSLVLSVQKYIFFLISQQHLPFYIHRVFWTISCVRFRNTAHGTFLPILHCFLLHKKPPLPAARRNREGGRDELLRHQRSADTPHGEVSTEIHDELLRRGGKQNFKRDLLEPLSGHVVYALPDADAVDDWCSTAADQRRQGFDIISPWRWFQLIRSPAHQGITHDHKDVWPELTI